MSRFCVAEEARIEVSNESLDKIIEDPKALESNDSHSNALEPSDEDISSIAENIKLKIEQYPELVNKLGNMLHIDTVMKLLDSAVSKLKTETDRS